MKNNNKERFLDCVGKVDDINIILKYKLGDVYNKKIFFT